MSLSDTLLAEQSDYYRQRAPEYEDWWFRRGRYDGGEESNARWAAEAWALESALARFGPRGQVLELNAALLPAGAVAYHQADLYAWEPSEAYDLCFFGFWLSHVPEQLFEAFWEKVRRALAPGGRVFFVDSAGGDLSSGVDRKPPEAGETMVRRLEDGREYRIVKRFYEPRALQDRLADLGWDVQVESTTEFFIHGQGSPRRPDR